MGFVNSGHIGVEKLEIRMKKGLYPEEQLIENHFQISLDVNYNPDDLKQGEYLNYERLVEIIVLEMKKDVNLLEAVAENMISAVFDEWKVAERALVKIEKLNPAFVGLKVGGLLVALERKRFGIGG